MCYNFRILKWNPHSDHNENSSRVHTKEMRKEFKYFTAKKKKHLSTKEDNNARTRVGILMSDKIKLKSKCITRDEEGHYAEWKKPVIKR